MDTSTLSDAELDAFYAMRREARERGAAEAAASSLSVAVALEEQYRPRFAGDELPASDAGACLALADRLGAKTLRHLK